MKRQHSLRIDDDVWANWKLQADKRGISITELIEERMSLKPPVRTDPWKEKS